MSDEENEFKIVKPKFLKRSKREKLIKKKAELETQLEAKRKEKLVNELACRKQRKIHFMEARKSDLEVNVNPVTRKIPTAKDSKQNKFIFDWSMNEDTSSEYKSLLEETLEDKRKGEQIPSFLAKRLNWNDVHWSKKPLKDMTARDWRILKEDFEINSKSQLAENPLRSWDESSIPTEVLEILMTRLRYNEPTPIQRAAIPIALHGKDVLGIAETGSGKTLSFVVPLLTYLLKLPRAMNITRIDGPYALILVPTRELAQQIQNEILKFTKYLKNITSTAIYGGHQLEANAYELEQGIDILVATPGRLIDAFERKILVLNQCFYLVMDEADRMIDLGFENQVNKILSILPKVKSNISARERALALGIRRNTNMMFTATMPKAIEKLVHNYLDCPSNVVIGNPEQAADTVEQRVEFVNDNESKDKKLIKLLNSYRYKPPIIIFVNYKKSSEALQQLIEEKTKLRPVIMHGSKSQEKREYAIQGLKNGVFDVLVATDLAGRGIDIPNVSLVVNYQMSNKIEDYIHRIGRTGRAGNRGTAITYLNSDEDKEILYDLKSLVSKSPLSICPDELRRHPSAMYKPASFKSIND